MAFGSPEWMYSSGFYPKEINNSCRFNDGSSSYLTRTPGSAGNNRTFTWSGWVKLADITTTRVLMGAGPDVNNRFIFFMNVDGTLTVSQNVSGTANISMTFTPNYRDDSGWYHFTLVVDTTDGLAADRVKVFVNNERVPTGASGPSLNQTTWVNSVNIQRVASTPYNSSYFDGYMAEVILVDGQALTPEDFGELKSGVWVPISYAGTYGTNGYRLDFADGGNLGNDVSGNGNDYTTSGLGSVDQMLDTPTNNFATMSQFGSGPNATLSEGNLKAVSTTTVSENAGSIFRMSGKCYLETVFTSVSLSSACFVAIITVAEDGSTAAAGIRFNGTLFGSVSGTAPSGYAVNQIIGMEIDLDNKTLQYYKNGVANGGLLTLTAAGDLESCVSYMGNEQYTFYINYGADSSFAGQKTRQGNTDSNGNGDFYYEPSAGFLAWCTRNLPDPVSVVNPAVGNSPQDYFTPIPYTGNGGVLSIDTGFQPDLVWIKQKDNASRSHFLQDVIRGPANWLRSNVNSAEGSSVNSVTSFDTDGFTLGSEASFNSNLGAYISWSWKAGGAEVTNTDGTITSEVSAAPEAGFSIVSWVADGTNGETIGHGLDKAPQLIISKNRDGTNAWAVQYTAVDGTLDIMYLNQTDATTNDLLRALPTATVFDSLSYANTDNVISYCFHSVEGFSKVGTYNGNGSTDGPFVYCGFRPAYILIKRTNGTSDWYVYDDRRDAFNEADTILRPNLTAADATAGDLDMLSNGFKLRTTSAAVNASSAPNLFMAFAKNPFKYSNAR